jgi:propanol-preferring alcohol dehydrogenase
MSQVRRGGKIVNVGSLDTENTIHMKIGVRKRLIFIFSYGGTVKDLEEVLELIAKRKINPRVTDGKIKDFPTVLKDLHAGKLKTRFALLHD